MKTNCFTTQKEERLALANISCALNWDDAVFTGTKKIGGLQVWCAIKNGGNSSIRAVYGKFTTKQYVSYMDNVIVPMWNANKNLYFVQ